MSRQANHNLAPLPAIPHHIGIIMDGNGRWAQARGLPRLAGHQAGVDNIQPVLEFSVEMGVKVLTIYAFSTENWQRPPDEVSGLMRLLGLTIQRQLNELNRNGVRILHSGRMEGISTHLQRQIRRAVEVTKDNDRITLMLCSFDGPTGILRLYGRGRRVDLDAPEIRQYRDAFQDDFHPFVRQEFFVDVERVQTSCGYAVPKMDFVSDRDTLDRYCENKMEPRDMVDGVPQAGPLTKKDGSLVTAR